MRYMTEFFNILFVHGSWLSGRSLLVDEELITFANLRTALFVDLKSVANSLLRIHDAC